MQLTQKRSFMRALTTVFALTGMMAGVLAGCGGNNTGKAAGQLLRLDHLKHLRLQPLRSRR